MPEDEIPQYVGNAIPKFLWVTYIALPLWGIYALYTYWNGSEGVLDPGTWHELQVAADTTMPLEEER